MIFVILSGGLGNQMFQLATGYQIAKINHEKLVVDILSYSFERSRKPIVMNICNQKDIVFRKFNGILIFYWIKRIWKTMIAKITGKGFCEIFHDTKIPFAQVITEETPLPFTRNQKKNCVLSGYFQSNKYFDMEAASLFFTDYKTDEATSQLAAEMKNTKSVAVHVRRGDYVQLGMALGTEYYRKAVAYLKERIGEDAVFYVFSDDLDWCKENFTFFHFIPVDVRSGQKDTDELYLMSSCQNNIIANSTYSWWGSFLNTHKEKVVVAPDQPFNNADIIPDGWIKI